MIINNNELKFAEKVILIDAAYINKVTADLSAHLAKLSDVNFLKPICLSF